MFHRKRATNLKFLHAPKEAPKFSILATFRSPTIARRHLLRIAFEMRCSNKDSEVNIIRLKQA